MNRMITAPVAALALLGATTAQAVELKVLEWEGYISPFAADFTAWAKTKGKDVTLTFTKGADGKQIVLVDPEQLYDLTRKGEADIVTPTNSYYKGQRGGLMKILHPVDVAKLSNWNDITESLRKATFATDEAGRYAVPLLGGSYALAYNANKVKAPDSWAILTSPEVKGKVSMTNAQFEANLYNAALLSGVAPADVYDDTKVDAAKLQPIVNAMVANAAGNFWGPEADPTDELHYVTTYWFAVAAANKKGLNWKFADPKEGQTVWLDNLSIAKSVETDPAKLEAAYLLLDFMISPEIQKKIYDLYGVVAVNAQVKDLLPVIDAKTSRIGDPTFFKEELFWQPLSARTRNFYKKIWDDAVAAAGK